jgi:hypothetical protein
MMKAFDHVDWQYMEAITLKLGFSSSWVALTMRVMSTVSFSILFMEYHMRSFLSSGIRKGDPISLYIISVVI